jgi:hypothetical protein
MSACSEIFSVVNGNCPIALRSILSRCWGCDADDSGESSQNELQKPHGSLLPPLKTPVPVFISNTLRDEARGIASDIAKLAEFLNL